MQKKWVFPKNKNQGCWGAAGEQLGPIFRPFSQYANLILKACGLGCKGLVGALLKEKLGGGQLPQPFLRALCHCSLGGWYSWECNWYVKWLQIFSGTVQTCAKLREILGSYTDQAFPKSELEKKLTTLQVLNKSHNERSKVLPSEFNHLLILTVIQFDPFLA